MKAKQLIIDHTIQVFLGDKILDPVYAAQFPGATVLSCLTRQARERGWEVHTSDVFLATVKSAEKTVCISNEFTPLFKHLIERGVIPALLISGESPNVDREFYRKLPIGSKPFYHACLFRGSISRLDLNCKGHVFLWPCPERVLETEKPWLERNLICMVASYKLAWSGLRNLPKFLIPQLVWKLSQLREDTLRFKDLYPLRVKLARHFGPNDGFRLYGYGWAEIMLKPRWWRKKFRFAHMPTSCPDKLTALGDGRFSLILENCVYPGYVTEKIFDAFRAGTVPIYLGAPDIEDFVPPDCFIDFRRFANPDSLWKELAEMSETQWSNYRQNIRFFLQSSLYRQHLEENVASQWLDWIEQV